MNGYIGRGPVGSIEDILKEVLLTTPLKYKGLWTPDTVYNAYDIVVVPPGSMYVCMLTHRSDLTFAQNVDKFDLFSSRFLIGEAWDINLNYLVGETVIYNNSVYIATDLSTGIVPTNTDYWDLAVSDLGRQTSNNVNITGGNITATTLGTGSITTDLIPSTDGTLDLGSATNKWNDLYLNGNTIYLGEAQISSDGITVTITTSTGSQFVLSENGIAGGEIQINDNEIVTTTLDTDLILNPAGTGIVDIKSNAKIEGDLEVTGTIEIGGNITIGGTPLDSITVEADFTSDLIPDASDTYDLGSNTQSWRELFVDTVTSNGGILTVDGALKVVSTAAVTLPVGTEINKQAFTAETGQIRFNTDISQFEGYQGTVWSSLGGVRSVDGATFISPELTPNASDNTLRFVTDNVQRMSLSTSILELATSITTLDVKATTTSTTVSSGALVVAGGVGIAENLNVGQDVTITGNLTVNGTTTTLNTATLDIEDLNITLAKGAVNAAAANGSGLTVDGANATIVYTSSTDSWNLNKPLIGTSVAMSGLTTLATAEVSDLVSGRITYAGANGRLRDSANLTYNGLLFTVTGNQLVTGTLQVNGAAQMAGISASTGTFSGTLAATGNFSINTNKFTVTAASGNTAVAGSMAITGATTITSTLNVGSTLNTNGNFTVNTNRFTVTATNGNTAIAGTLAVTGNTTLTGTLAVTGTSTLGAITASTGSFSGQVTSTVASGTAPLVVTSTTKVDNLNADLLDGFNTSELNEPDTVVIRNSSRQILMTSAAISGALSGTTILAAELTGGGTLTLPSTTDILVGQATTDTLTNKTVNLSSNTLTGTLVEFNAALTGADFASLAGIETLTNKTVNLSSNTLTGTLAQFNTALTGADFASLAGIETLTNKTVNLASNTLTGTLAEFNTAITDADMVSTSGIETLTNKTINLASNTLVGTTAEFNAALSDDDFATLTGTETLTNKSIDLTTNTLTGTTAEFNAALSDDDFATLTGTETLTNKSIDLTTNTLTGTTAEFNLALSDDDFATLTGTETLTNKSIDLTTNTLTGTTAEFNLALSDDDFATLTGTETLTNKSIDLATNTLVATAEQIFDAVTGKTGTGSLVFNNSPTLVTPILGTPQSATLTNATGLPVSTGISGLGTGIATFLATPSSANFAAAITNETGTGSVVFSADPTFTGTATFAEINTLGDTDIGGNLVVTGDLTVVGTTTTVSSTTITVADKNIELGLIETPTDITADGGGLTLKGTTDKTFNWVNATTAWTSSENLNLATGKEYRINGTSVLSATSLGSNVVNSSLTSVGTLGSGTWNASVISGEYGGTGVANTGKTIALGGSIEFAGNFTTKLNVVSNTDLILPTTGTLVTLTGTETLTNKSIDLTTNTLTGTTAEFNSALSDDDFATLTGTETLTNKSINLASNTLTGTTAEFNTALSDDNFATLTGTETLTNKTLSDPTINAASGVLVLPQATTPSQTANGSVSWDADDALLTIGTGSGRKTLVDTDSTQTLTNKTLTSPVITGISPTITLDGDLTGSITLTDLGGGTLTATIAANSVALGTDTTGNYIATIAGTANQISVSGSGSETSAVTLSLPQDIHTAASPTFDGATLGNVQVGITNNNSIDTATGGLTLDSASGTTTVDDNLVVSGNLVVQGTTTTVNSTVLTVVDPIISIGGDANGLPNATNDSKDRGVAFSWHNDTVAKTGYFGFDRSSNYFTFIPDATISSEVISGSPGDILAGTFRGNLIASTVTVSDSIQAIGDITLASNSGNLFAIAPVDVGTVNNVNIGNITPGTAAFTTLTASDSTTFTSTVDSVDKNTGAVVIEGGVGIEKNLNVGGNIDITGTLSVDGTVLFGGALAIESGGTGRTSFTDNGIVYGNGTDSLEVTDASSFTGDNETISYGILTTTAAGIPVWTDVIDGGEY
jgi:hypothetical protein